mgnify:CR=1 FL=1
MSKLATIVGWDGDQIRKWPIYAMKRDDGSVWAMCTCASSADVCPHLEAVCAHLDGERVNHAFQVSTRSLRSLMSDEPTTQAMQAREAVLHVPVADAEAAISLTLVERQQRTGGGEIRFG